MEQVVECMVLNGGDSAANEIALFNDFALQRQRNGVVQQRIQGYKSWNE